MFKKRNFGKVLIKVCLFIILPSTSTSQLNYSSKANKMLSCFGFKMIPIKSETVEPSMPSIYSTFSPQKRFLMFYLFFILDGLPSPLLKYFLVYMRHSLSLSTTYMLIQFKSFSSPYSIFSPTEFTRFFRTGVGSKYRRLLSFIFANISFSAANKRY